MIKFKPITSVEIFGSGRCNIDCNYCYIPKLDCMDEIHREIIDTIKSGRYFDFLEEHYGKDLRRITIWGGEPTFALPFILNNANEMLERFPKLSNIWLSTNFIKNASLILKFIKEFPRKRRINFGLQISVDGGPEITDVNRTEGASRLIERNMYNFLNNIQDIDLSQFPVNITPKMTWGADNIKFLCDDEDATRRCFAYCNRLSNQVKRLRHPGLTISFTPVVSLALPGKYTVADGKRWAKMCHLLDTIDMEEGRTNNNSRNSYKRALNGMMSSIGQYWTHHDSLTCGAGSSMWQVGHKGEVHICHRTLFGNNEPYLNAIKGDNSVQERWNVTNFDTEIIEMINDRFIVDVNDQDNVDRLSYATTTYHHMPQFKTSNTTGNIMILARCGQVSECYQNEQLAQLLAMFIHDCLPCPTEYLVNTGSLHTAPISLAKIFGNGAFEKLLKDYNDPMRSGREGQSGGKIVFGRE